MTEPQFKVGDKIAVWFDIIGPRFYRIVAMTPSGQMYVRDERANLMTLDYHKWRVERVEGKSHDQYLDH